MRILRSQSLAYSAAILAIGLAYRASFISQGYNATDEGWLQTLGARIAHGQVPYRDFYYHFPPVAAYKEAALIRLFGDAYGILASRWAFALEASLASVLAFLVVRRFVAPHLAFLATLPTIFFSVIFYYFSNYTYDAVFLSLLSVTFLFHPIGWRVPRILLSGGFAAMAFLAKPPFLGFVIAVPLLVALDSVTSGPHSDRRGMSSLRRDWPLFMAGFVLVCLLAFGYFSFEQVPGQFLYQAFVLGRMANPTSLAFDLWQDLPDRLLSSATLISLLALLLLALFRFKGIVDGLRLVALAAVLGLLVFRARQPATTGYPTSQQQFFVVLVLGLLLLLTFLATMLSVLAHGAWLSGHPTVVALRTELFEPGLPAVALVLQYLAQYNYAGIEYSYVGSFLSVPVALLFVRGMARAKFGGSQVVSWRPTFAAVTPFLIGIWIVVGSIVVTRGTAYRDGTRGELTSSFQTPRLAGITSLPSNVALVDGLVRETNTYTRPGEPILIFPDFPVLYFLTGRTNPTGVDWYDTIAITPSMVNEAVSRLNQVPARVVFMQTYDGGDFRHSGPKLDYAAVRKLSPLYAYVISHYVHVATVSGVFVFVPKAGP